jgi:hypothetical protein
MALLLLCSMASTAPSQVISLNVIGYYNLPLFPGDNFIANQLDNPNGNTINSLLTGTITDGSTFTKWDSVANTFLPESIYDASSGHWSINYSLSLLEGGLFNSPGPATNTFVGQVNQTYYVIDAGFVYSAYPHYAPGLHLLACPVPIAGADFTNVVGRDPRDGEWVETLDAATQTERVTTFHSSSGTWDNGTPSLAVGQSAFFDLVPVPEPSALALAGLGASLGLVVRRRNPVR